MQETATMRRLARWHFLLAGLVAFLGSLPMLYMVSGVLLLLGVLRPAGASFDVPADLEAARAIGLLIIVGAGAVTAACWVLALLILTAGKRLAAARYDSLCRTVACLECLAVPFGTILGLVTLRAFPGAPGEAERKVI